MDAFKIQGGTPLRGKVRISGAKNAALPILAAALLTDEPLILDDVPGVNDIRTMRRLLEVLGVDSRDEDGSVVLQPSSDPLPAGPHDEAHYDLVRTMRASVLVLGPLLARRGHARVSLPGGCAIGVRPIDQHLRAMRALGAEVELSEGYVDASARRLIGGRFRFDNPTVGGTENVLMAACLAKGSSRLENCAQEPEIEDLARLLKSMGARIVGAGSETIEVEGVDELHGTRHRVIADRIEAGTYLIAGAITRGDIEVTNVRSEDLRPLLEKLEESGVELRITADAIGVRCSGVLRSRDMVTAPHPGFPTDLQAQYMALMTQAEGTSTICETVFENRFQHVPELTRMGASIRVDGSFARVVGPRTLSGANVMATDLRASACLVLAGLAAVGETCVHRIYHLERGYHDMDRKLRELGADVARVVDS